MFRTGSKIELQISDKINIAEFFKNSPNLRWLADKATLSNILDQVLRFDTSPLLVNGTENLWFGIRNSRFGNRIIDNRIIDKRIKFRGDHLIVSKRQSVINAFGSHP